MSAPKMYPSKALPPIKPLRGVSGVAALGVRRKPATAPDWAYWPASRPVAPWQAVALSLNLDPDSLKHSPHSWMAGPDSGPSLESEGFPDAEIEAAFRKRLAQLAAFVSHSSRVPLGELAGMLVAHTLPPKLATMATALADASIEPQPEVTSDAQSSQPEGPSVETNQGSRFGYLADNFDPLPQDTIAETFYYFRNGSDPSITEQNLAKWGKLFERAVRNDLAKARQGKSKGKHLYNPALVAEWLMNRPKNGQAVDQVARKLVLIKPELRDQILGDEQ